MRELAQLRLLSHPLRLRILHALSRKPRTTKQVADLLDLPPTRLYHHVGQLEDAGLLRLVHTRPVRGTVEKYYQAIAQRFVAATDALDPDGTAPARSLALDLIDGARRDLLDSPHDEADRPLVARGLVVASPARLQEVKARILAWLEDLNVESDATHEGPEQDEAWSLTVAFLRSSDARRPAEEPGPS